MGDIYNNMFQVFCPGIQLPLTPCDWLSILAWRFELGGHRERCALIQKMQHRSEKNNFPCWYVAESEPLNDILHQLRGCIISD